MTDALLASYEAVPYDSKPIPAAHPDAMAAVAALHGVAAPRIEHCRVLELGCASGGNLIPIALAYPAAKFVGIDLAPGQIADGRATVDVLGLENIELDAMSIADVDEGFGIFDYIICHGVYSWVPPQVQDAILRVCSRNLAPDGLAYVSYNTYPGWHVRGMVRDMIMFHDDPTLAPAERVARGRAVAELIAKAVPSSQTLHAALLREELGTIKTQTDIHFLHEQLAPVNEPVYFAEFARRAAEKGLRYVGEAKLSATVSSLPEEVRRVLGDWSADVIQLEQYLDFVRGRTFRRTVLCRGGVAVERSPSPHALRSLHLAAHCHHVEPPKDAREGAESFQSPSGTTVTTNQPHVIDAMNMLIDAAPAAVRFNELWERVRESDGEPVDGHQNALGGATPDPESALASAMLQCALGQLIELHFDPPHLAAHAGARPIGSRLARHQAETKRLVTNLRHYPVEISDVERLMLAHLDGSHDRDDLVTVLGDAIARGDLSPGAERPARSDLLSIVEASLRRITVAALLVG